MRPRPVLAPRQIGQGAGQIQVRQGPRRGADPGRTVQNGLPQHGIEPLFNLKRMATGIEDAGFHLGQIRRGEPQLVRRGLAVTEHIRQGFRQHPLGMGGGDFDEITQHVVVLDLQRRNSGLPCIIRLHPRDDRPPLIPQAAHLIQFGVIPRRDEAAIPHQKRRFRDKGLSQQIQQLPMATQIGCRLREQRWQFLPIDQPRDAVCLLQSVADRRQIARPAPIQRQS